MEWVYNEADIGRAKVIWARDMGDRENGRLIAQYAGRRVWLIEPDLYPNQLRPYEIR